MGRAKERMAKMAREKAKVRVRRARHRQSRLQRALVQWSSQPVRKLHLRIQMTSERNPLMSVVRLAVTLSTYSVFFNAVSLDNFSEARSEGNAINSLHLYSPMF